jgi:hypothetical protein
MGRASLTQNSFNAGELSALILGRQDVAKYQSGLYVCLNSIPLVQGAWTRRPGFAYLHQCKHHDKLARVIPFQYSITQTYVLEFGEEYIRFFTSHGILTATAQNITGITKANPAVVTYSGADTYANGDRVYISGVVGMTQVNNREFIVAGVNTGANTFQLTDSSGANVNSSSYGTYTSGGTVAEIIEVVTEFQEAELADIRVVQSADTLYILHPDYPPQQLVRVSATSWTLSDLVFTDGPYDSLNTTTTTLTPGAATNPATTNITAAADNGSGAIRITSVAHGAVTDDWVLIASVGGTTEANGVWKVTRIDADNIDLVGSTFTNAYTAGGTVQRYVSITASAITGINSDTGFQTTDVGRLIRIREGSTWGYCEIVGRNSTTVVFVDVLSTLTDTTSKTDWRMGLWSDTTGWPRTGTFHDDRLFLAGAATYPQRLDGSKTGVYTNFSPSASNGDIANDNAVSFVLNSDDVNAIKWLHSDEKGLLTGTARGEWQVRPSSLTEAITPTNISAKPTTHYGSADVAPARAGKAVLFVQRAERKVREMAYVFEVDGFRAPDLTLLAEHITRPAITEVALQTQPQTILWGVRSDGVLLGMTYERDQDVVAWHRHELGGQSDSAGLVVPVVESVAVVPAPDATRDELYAVVQRYINGAERRYIEYQSKIWEVDDEQEDAFHVDCGWTVVNAVAASTVTGLWHLEGETVGVYIDGTSHPDVTITNGTATLERTGTIVTLGYFFESDGNTMPVEGGAADGTAQGKTKRIHRVGFWLLDTLGLQFGPDEDNLTEIVVRQWGDAFGAATPLFTGVTRERFESDYDRLGQIYWRADGPFPATVLAVMPQLNTADDS